MLTPMPENRQAFGYMLPETYMARTLIYMSASPGMFHPGLGCEEETSPGPLGPHPTGLLIVQL